MRFLLALLPFALTACDKSSGDAPEQLETLLVEIGYAEVEDSYAGTLAVSGADQDWSLSITPAVGEAFSWTVHSPAEVDLSTLAGEDRTLTLLSEVVFEERSFVLSDASGPAYIADIGENASDVASLLDTDPARFGEVLASDEDENFTSDYTTLIFPSDDGEVELMPGDVTTLSINGVSWRVTAIAAYDREMKEGGSFPGCPFIVDMLSYEMIRVETVEADEARVRPEGMSGAKVGCGG